MCTATRRGTMRTIRMTGYFILFAMWLGVPLVLAQETDEDGFREMRVAPGHAESADIIELVRPFLMFDASIAEREPSLELTMEKSENGYRFDVITKTKSAERITGGHYRGEIIRYEGDRWLLLDLYYRPILPASDRSKR